jgi:hypothetical protein
LSANESNQYLRRSRKHRDEIWAKIGVVGSLAPEIDERWPILRLVVDLKMPLSEVEKWDIEDIMHLNSVLDMRSDYESAADAYEAMETKKAAEEAKRKRK